MTRRHRRSRRGNDWISRAIENRGALRDWFKRNRRDLKQLLGYDPFKKRGSRLVLKTTAIRDTLELAETGRLRVRDTTLRRLRLALTLAELRRRRK